MDFEQTNKSEKSFWQEHWIELLIASISVVAIVAMVYLMTLPDQTPREAALEAIILTIASIAASFLITKVYAEAGYSQSLRDHGVQIASNIIVLKRQIEDLSDWIAQKRATLPHADREFDPADQILEHIEETLKGFRGMTNSALGGIAGVIGDAIAQYETVMEQVSRVRSEALSKTEKIQQEIKTAVSNEEVTRLQAQLREIELKTEKQISQLARTSALPIPEIPQLRLFNEQCPYCSRRNTFEMVDEQGETKLIYCQHCQRGFNAHVLSGHKVVTRGIVKFDPRIVTVKSYNSLQSIQNKAKNFLIETNSWVEPDQLIKLLPIVISADQHLKQSNSERTPHELQHFIFNKMINDIINVQISNSTVRKFFKLLYQGNAFEFTGENIGFKTTYINDLDNEKLLNAYIKGCIKRLLNEISINEDDIPEIANLILSDHFSSGGELVRQFLYEFKFNA